MPDISLVWFREDLRLSDNPALHAAMMRKAPIVCCFILEETTTPAPSLGSARKWWLHHSLLDLQKNIERAGGQMILRRGDAATILPELAVETGAQHIMWNRRYHQHDIAADKALKQSLSQRHTVTTFNARLLYEPWEIATGSGTPYRVFTPLWKAIKARNDIRNPVPRVTKITPLPTHIPSDTLADWALLPRSPDWAAGFQTRWTPGEKGAQQRLTAFLDGPVAKYKDDRNRPDKVGTSYLSPHLQYGEISPVQIWAETQKRLAANSIPADQADVFLSEIAWREFAHSLLYYNQDMTDQEIMPKFAAFPWQNAPEHLQAWQQGQTGYPIVDAGMRELWQTGWMHNRVRMIVGSFLVKHLLIDWRAGMKWFWDTLLDADIASNTAGWQWIAGCGADAAPYFRIFNPMVQGEKFDPQGTYVRKYVTELEKMPTKYIHTPWEAPTDILKQAGVTLGATYPKPIVDHKIARQKALDAYETVKKTI